MVADVLEQESPLFGAPPVVAAFAGAEQVRRRRRDAIVGAPPRLSATGGGGCRLKLLRKIVDGQGSPRGRDLHVQYHDVPPIIMSGALGLIMAFIAYGRLVLKPIQAAVTKTRRSIVLW